MSTRVTAHTRAIQLTAGGALYAVPTRPSLTVAPPALSSSSPSTALPSAMTVLGSTTLSDSDLEPPSRVALGPGDWNGVVCGVSVSEWLWEWRTQGLHAVSTYQSLATLLCPLWVRSPGATGLARSASHSTHSLCQPPVSVPSNRRVCASCPGSRVVHSSHAVVSHHRDRFPAHSDTRTRAHTHE